MAGSKIAMAALAGFAMLMGLALYRTGSPAWTGEPPAARQTPPSPTPSSRQDEFWSVRDPDTLPDDEWGRTVRLGRDLITRTATLIGPEVADRNHRYAGNNLNCQSCHLDAGTKPFGNPLVGAFLDYPSYRARSGKVGTIEDRIQGCMTRSMNGRTLPEGSPELTAITAYLRFLASGHRVGEARTGRGTGRMPELTRAADPVRGKSVYASTCAACHGENGLGMRTGAIGDAQGYAVPPLWGQDSYNDGAGMARLIDSANFIHNNMPHGTTFEAPALSVEQAWDVAAYINSQPRPHRDALDKDYPHREEKPVDSPYAPWADDFSPEQHRLGPFQPIRDALKQRKAMPATQIN